MKIHFQTNENILKTSEVKSDKFEIESHTDHSEKNIKFCDDASNCTNSHNQQQPTADSFEIHCRMYANNRSGSLIKKLEQKPMYLFTCDIQHKFFLSRKQITSGIWCSNCRKLHANLNNFAVTNNGSLLTPIMKKRMSFKCCKNHNWNISYKKATQRWCKICSKQTKKLLKTMIQIENAKIENEKKAHQVS